MGFLKKLSSAFGSLSDQKAEESSALDTIRKLKEELGMPQSRKDEDDEEEYDDNEELEEDEELEELEELEEEENEELEEEEEEEELVENRAKPIFIVRLKRFDAPLSPESVQDHKDELESYNSDCILMRDNADDTYRAVCFFGQPADQLMNQALSTLEEWIEEEEENIVPVIDILTGVEWHNCEIDNETVRKAAYFIVNAYAEETDEIMKSFPVRDSLVRIIREVDGEETIKDVLAYPNWCTLDDDDEGWVGKMISEHGIRF